MEGDIPTFALVGYVAFLAVAFGWRSWLQVRRTGDSGLRVFSGGTLDRSASALILVGILLAPIAPLLELADWMAPLSSLARPMVHVVGVAAFFLGFGLTVIAQLEMGVSWRIGVSTSERTALVTDGVFSVVRNPIYTGMALALVGLGLLVPNGLSVVSALCMLTGLEVQVRLVEEPWLLRVHGDTYLDYARSVGRFVPGLGRLR